MQDFAKKIVDTYLRGGGRKPGRPAAAFNVADSVPIPALGGRRRAPPLRDEVRVRCHPGRNVFFFFVLEQKCLGFVFVKIVVLLTEIDEKLWEIQ